MTETEAKNILAKPVFGDQRCIEARDTLERIEEERGLAKFLEGKLVECWCCSGRGTIECDAMCSSHPCPTCDRSRKIQLTAKILSQLSLGQLRELAKEFQLANTGSAKS